VRSYAAKQLQERKPSDNGRCPDYAKPRGVPSALNGSRTDELRCA
jgi:hypothetical protein